MIAPEPGEPVHVDAGATDGPYVSVSRSFIAQADQDRAAVERVEALHVPDFDKQWCGHDGWPYPCPTIRALRGKS